MASHWRISRLLIPLTTLALSACTSLFAKLPPTVYTRTDGLAANAPVQEMKLTAPLTACRTTFPTGTRLNFGTDGIETGLSWAVLAAPATLDGHTYGTGTKLHFLSEPRKLFAAEQCDLEAAELAVEETFGSAQFGPTDKLANYRSGVFRNVTLGETRTIAGKSYGAKFELNFDESGALVTARSPTDVAMNEVRANAAQKAADNKQATCSARCAPLTGASRSDCINNCLYH